MTRVGSLPGVERRREAPQRVAALDRGVYLVAGAVTVVLLGLSGRYGPHRDELYFLAAGDHPDWGYPDQPPLTPLIAALADGVAPGSLLALRVVPALVAGLVVVLLADLARELGGGRSAQLLTALVTATGAGLLVVCHMLSTATLDLAAWTVVIWLTVRLLHRDTPRSWLLVGLAVGVGLQNKHLIALLATALAVGVAVTPSLRHHLRSPWPYAGAALASVIWLPNLLWQAANGWPQLELAADVRAEYGTAAGAVELVALQLILLSPVGFVLAAIGLVALLRRPDWAFARPVAVAYLGLLPFFLLTGGKGYYLLPLLPPLAAAGVVVLEQRWSAYRLKLVAAAVAVIALFPLPALLPVLPAETLDGTFYPAMNEDGMETIGWPRVVATVREVVDGLPVAQRDSAVVVTSNYGEAGSLQWYGLDAPVHSGHNAYADWGPPRQAGPVVWVGFRAPDPAALAGCRRAATLDTGVDNEEDGNGVWVCTGPSRSWPHAWRLLTHLSA
jgi:hypothetical protein